MEYGGDNQYGISVIEVSLNPEMKKVDYPNHILRSGSVYMRTPVCIKIIMK